MAKEKDGSEKKGETPKRVEMPPYSLAERQYLGINLGVLGCVILLGGMAQEYVRSDLFMWVGFAIVLVGLFFHETRPLQRRGWGDITDEFRSGMSKLEEADAKKKDKKTK
ncbi:hypothetical protein HOP50_02g11670 [Chloropicon primus]|uniref:Uncharacterized protein n=1 Tax=Chloropicon primus TaxID=1764295 RepID=A0A5B8MES6_9CHLO|nr:hypothetical protein A3770_02p11820 [Chloropicon primus]UPQ97872.1 hypothetical protein HOP50_02g11670 [Chloropicon primus]|eukprot:QDZ18664.1 hypothetical protein A3770_02p11820 [Chloropicon primus]